MKTISLCANCLQEGKIKAPEGVIISHGICDFHRDEMMKELEELMPKGGENGN